MTAPFVLDFDEQVLALQRLLGEPHRLAADAELLCELGRRRDAVALELSALDGLAKDALSLTQESLRPGEAADRLGMLLHRNDNYTIDRSISLHSMRGRHRPIGGRRT